VKSPPIALKFTNPDQLSNDEVQRIFDRANRLPDTAAAVRLYSEWAAIYDETVCRFGEYLTPATAAAAISELAPDRTACILDAACGSGLLGELLSAMGYTAIDGVDVTPAMLERAARKCCYRTLTIADLYRTLPFPTGSFDVATCIGAFTVGHVNADAIANLLDVLKPGGILYCDVEHSWWSSRGFGTLFHSLLAEGRLSELNLKSGYCYAPAENEPTQALFVTAWKS